MSEDCVIDDGRLVLVVDVAVCFFKQKTAYEMRISDWSSDVCSSDLATGLDLLQAERHGRGPRLIKGYRSHIYSLGKLARHRIDAPAELGKGIIGRVVRCPIGALDAVAPIDLVDRLPRHARPHIVELLDTAQIGSAHV